MAPYQIPLLLDFNHSNTSFSDASWPNITFPNITFPNVTLPDALHNITLPHWNVTLPTFDQVMSSPAFHFILGGLVALIIVLAMVACLGFGGGGVVAGSVAAGVQSVCYGGAVAAGSLFSLCQSIGAAGLGCWPATICFVVGGILLWTWFHAGA
ncbi:hypothetical protein DFJ77DRAFT_448476 [Powellomyces hirtus]|nr:hypothetical protein DFJ77DRAFT_448476 [Powellomyces hirtus]